MKFILNHFLPAGIIACGLLLQACDVSTDKAGERSDSLNTAASKNTVTDIEGNIYQTVRIGEQVWMKENLKVTRYRNGDAIPNMTDPVEWSNESEGAYCDFFNDTATANVYGKLYNWYAVADERKVCPIGWRVPTSSDFAELDLHLGNPSVSGAKLKEEGFSHWHKPNMGATNESGFTALPGGHRDSDGSFDRLGTYAYFWNKNEYEGEGGCAEDSMCAHECSVNSENSFFLQDWGFKNRGMSVRCIKEDSAEK